MKGRTDPMSRQTWDRTAMHWTLKKLCLAMKLARLSEATLES